jgi:O-antigen/teichoic acid export membrane protein
MKRELSRFAAHSGVYALGNLIYRGASFILIPLYVHYLTPAEYGTLEILTMTGTIVQTLLGAGVAHSVLRFYYEYTDPGDRRAIVSSALIGSMVFGVAGLLLILPFAERMSQAFFGTPEWATALRLVLVTIVFELSREISLAYVRATERSWLFVGLSVCQLLLQVAANLYTVAHLRMGALGIVIGNLFTVLVIWALLTRHTLRECGMAVHAAKLKALVRYGHPLMLSAIIGSLLNASDRYFLLAYISAASTGIYALALRIVQVVPVLLTDPFTKSFGPFRFAIMRQENAAAIYARVLLYYAALSGLATLALSAAAPELVDAISSEAYGAAASILPLVLVPVALHGVTYIFQTGSYVQKHTRAILYVTTISSVANFLLNLVLIPRYGIFGAASAAALAAVITVVLTYVFAQRALPIAYAPIRPLVLLGVAIATGIGLTLARESNFEVPLVARAALVAAYIAFIVWQADLRPSQVKSAWRQMSGGASGK